MWKSPTVGSRSRSLPLPTIFLYRSAAVRSSGTGSRGWTNASANARLSAAVNRISPNSDLTSNACVFESTESSRVRPSSLPANSYATVVPWPPEPSAVSPLKNTWSWRGTPRRSTSIGAARSLRWPIPAGSTTSPQGTPSWRSTSRSGPNESTLKIGSAAPNFQGRWGRMSSWLTVRRTLRGSALS